MTELFRESEFAAMVEQMIPMPGLPTPQDIADAAVYLASDESRYVTGSALRIDGAGQPVRPDTPSTSHRSHGRDR